MTSRSDQQRLLPLTRDERFGALKSINPSKLVAEGEPVGKRAWKNVVALCIEVELCSFRDGCYAYVNTLAERLGVHVRTLQRTSALAQAIGVLSVGERRNGDRQQSNEWSVDWSWVVGHADEPAENRRNVKTVTPPRQTVTPPRQTVTLIRGSVSTSISTEEPPPAPARSSGAECLNGVVGWEEVYLLLEEIGLAVGPAAVAAARRQGAEPSDVAEVVGVWQDHQTPAPPAWDRGALYTRLMIWRPGQSAVADWPKWHADHVRARQRIERDVRDRREAELLTDKRREKEARAAELVAERQKIGELEAIARSLTREEYSALLATIADPFTRTLAKRNPYGTTALTEVADALNQKRIHDGAGV